MSLSAMTKHEVSFPIDEIFQVAMFLQWNLIVEHPKILSVGPLEILLSVGRKK
jgi:hypothetical protein